MLLFPKIDISGATSFEKYTMFFLAAYPILECYVLWGTPFSYATFMGTVLFFITLFRNAKTISLPKTYLLFWLYAAVQIYFIAGIEGWSDYVPGGITLTVFSLSMIGLVSCFSLNTLYYYLTKIWGFAAILFFSQLVVFYVTGQKLSVFLPLAPETTYCGFTYADVVSFHQQISDSLIQRFSSIFCEPSYFAQYTLVLLTIELFLPENRHVVITKYSILLAFVIILIQSGVGLLGLGIVAIAKIFDLLFILKIKKYYPILIIILPIVFFVVSSYLSSDSGAYVASRTSELTTTDGSKEGSVRIYYGWFLIETLTPEQKMFGTSRNYLKDLVDEGFINGAQTIVGTMGWVAAVLLLFFYIQNTRKKGPIPILCGLLLLYDSLLESIYLSGFMMLCTVIILGFKQKQIYSKNKI